MSGLPGRTNAATGATLARRIWLAGAVVLGVGLVVAADLVALRAMDVIDEEVGGFFLFLNAVGLLAMTAIAVGVIIGWCVPGHPIGWLLVAGALLVQSVFVALPLVITDPASLPGPLAGVATWWATVVLAPALFMLFPAVGILCPDGHLPGPGWRPAVVIVVAVLALGVGLGTIAPWPTTDAQPTPNPFALPGVPLEVSALGGGLAALALFVGLALAAASLVIRFRRSMGAERAQLKWLVAAVAVMAVVFPLSFATDIGPADLVDLVSVLVGALIPLSIGVAILRYRLYDIDRVISRTIGWGLVTAALATVFIGGVVALQAVLSEVAQGQGGTVAIAASTLLAFALFQPIRLRVQRAVDRRFDRARYDAEQTAAAFAERLRHEVDMASVTDDLTRTADATVAPRSLGIWLREARR